MRKLRVEATYMEFQGVKKKKRKEETERKEKKKKKASKTHVKKNIFLVALNY